MSWKCNLCETVNLDENIICEICDSISPFLAKFDYMYEGETALIKWQAENACSIIAKYNSRSYDITNWKSARISLRSTLNIVSIIVANEVSERSYTFGIPKI